MNRLVSKNIWAELGRMARGKRRAAAIAYVTSDNYLKFGKNDVLVTDASDHAIRCGATSATVLQRAYDRGAQVYSLGGLHAKILACGDEVAVGSANMSESSDGLVEAAVISDDPVLITLAYAFIEQLTRLAKRVDDKFLSRILGIKVDRNPRGPRRGQTPSVEVRRVRTWIVGVRQLSDDAYPGEATAADAGEKEARARRASERSDVSWIRWAGKDRFATLAAENDSVIQIWRPASGKRARVFRHSRIRYRQQEPKCVRFYLEESPDLQDEAIPLGEFRKLAKRAGISGAAQWQGDSAARLVGD